MSKKVQRFGQVIQVKPDKLELYKYHHANPWPEVNAMIKKCHMENYSIYYRDGYLFSYFEYTGDNFEADMAMMAEDSKTQEWWALVKPFQNPLATKTEDEWWSDMEEVYHLD